MKKELDTSEAAYLVEKLAGNLNKKRIICAITPYDNLLDPNLGFRIVEETYEEWANRLKEQK